MLPPLGQITSENQGDAIRYIADLTLEGRSIRDAAIERASTCNTIYENATDSEDPDDPALVNDAQNAVIASTDMQTREPPDPTVVAVEQGEAGPWYWIGRSGQVPQMDAYLQPTLDAEGQVGPPPAVEEQLVEQLRAAGLERYLIQINDEARAKFYSILHKIHWKRSQSDQFLRRNLLRNNVVGWQFVRFLHDPYNHRYVYRKLSPRQVNMDLVEDIADAGYLIIDDVLAQDEALKYFPDLADAINAHVTPTGEAPQLFDNGGWGGIQGRVYYRPMVAMRFCWLRDQAIPMGEDEAVKLGHVLQVSEQFAAGLDERGMPVMQERPVPGQYTLPDGTPVAPGDELWPARFGIREIIQIGTEIVADRECQDWDIPVALNVNVPLLDTPFGYGEPWRIRGLQRAKNSMLASGVDYTMFYRFPPAVVPNSLKAQLGDANCIEPGQLYGIPDNLFQEMHGQVNMFMSLPQLPPGVSAMFTVVSSETDKQSQHTPVLQGYMPSATASGKTIEALQYSASSLISYKAKSTTDMVYRLCMLGLYALRRTLTVDEAMMMVSRYPRHVTAALLSPRQGAQFDIEVEVLAGNGAAQGQRRAQTNEDQTARRISMQTARERLNIDHYVESDRMASEARQQAALVAAAQPPMPATAPPGGPVR